MIDVMTWWPLDWGRGVGSAGWFVKNDRAAGRFIPEIRWFFSASVKPPAAETPEDPGMPNPKPFPDTRIAAEAQTRLAWDAAVPKDTVKIRVSHGHITVQGELHHDQQRSAVLEDVARLFGVTGVSDHTTIKRK